MVAGLVMVPFPGPGWLVVFIGVGILASEFDWAKRLLDFGRAKLTAWNDWMRPQPLWVKALAALLTALAVGAIFYLVFVVFGVPTFLPDIVEQPLLSFRGSDAASVKDRPRISPAAPGAVILREPAGALDV